MCCKYLSRRERLERAKFAKIRFFGVLANFRQSSRMVQNTQFPLVVQLKVTTVRNKILTLLVFCDAL